MQSAYGVTDSKFAATAVTAFTCMLLKKIVLPYETIFLSDARFKHIHLLCEHKYFKNVFDGQYQPCRQNVYM